MTWFNVFKKPTIIRHGDLVIYQINKIPETARQLSTNIIAEGEKTGHNHELYGSHQIFETWSGGIGMLGTPKKNMYIKAKLDIFLKHPEHNTLKISKGDYIIFHEREFDILNCIEKEVLD